MRTRFVAVAAAAVVLSGLTVPVVASAATAAPPARQNPGRVAAEARRPTGRLQVKFKSGVGATARAAAYQRAASAGHTLKVEKRINALNASIVRASDLRAAARILRGDPRVEYVEPESRYKAFEAEPVSRELTEIGADQVHSDPLSPNTGAGMEIAILDSPVSSSLVDFNGAGKVVSAGDFTTDYPEPPGDPFTDSACDAVNCPHGTGVASAAAAEADDAGMVGVAPGATIRSYTVFRHWTYDDGEFVFHDVSADSGAIADALTAVATYGATHPNLVAVNMSLGSKFDNRLIRDAIAYVRSTAPQVTIVVAAGNDGGERANFPAGDPYVLSVGATGQGADASCATTPDESTPWTVASFSNRGDVDVVAPGQCVDVLYPLVSEETGESTGTVIPRKENGTSFAAPMVAGMVALLGADGVKGDAARAAILASAEGTPDISVGLGRADAVTARVLADGTAPYTALSIDRGGQVASNVGRRDVEVIRVDPTGGSTPTVPTPTVPTGYGTVTAGTLTSATGVSSRRFTYAVPDVNKAGQTFSMTAAGENGAGDDTVVVPMKMLDAYNGYEGLPTASGEAGAVPLTYGTRSAYIRSMVLPSTRTLLEWTYTYGATPDPMTGHQAELLLWEPTEVNGVADAAMEPFWGSYPAAGESSGSDAFDTDYRCAYLGGDPNDLNNYAPCKAGRYLIGFLAYNALANSTGSQKYALNLTYSNGPTLTTSVPTIASAVSSTGPFTVAWGGTRAVKWDVEWGYRVKSGSTWGAVTNWQTWKSKTTSKSGVFGSGGSPTTIVPGRVYWFRIRGYDSLGNPTLLGVKSTSAPYDDRSGSIVYSTGSTAWTKVVVSGRWLKTAQKSSAAGARAALTAETTSFSIVGDKCATCGQFKVYVDGVYKKTVDTYRSSTAVRQTLWSSGTLSGGIKSHRVTIIVVGTKNRPKVVLDGIAIQR